MSTNGSTDTDFSYAKWKHFSRPQILRKPRHGLIWSKGPWVVEVYLYDALPMFPILIYFLIRSVTVFHMTRTMRMTALMPLIWTTAMATAIPDQFGCRTMSINLAG